MQLGQRFGISGQKPSVVQHNMGTAIHHHNNQRMGGRERGREGEEERVGERKRERERVRVMLNTQPTKDVGSDVAL